MRINNEPNQASPPTRQKAATVSAKKDEKPQELKREELLDQLGRAADLRSSEDQVLWSIFGAFWAANTVLLVALFATGKLPENYIGVVLSLVGVLLSAAWCIIQERTLGHIIRFETLMERLECKLKIPTDCATSSNINVEDYATCVPQKVPSARTMMRICSGGAVASWILGLFFFCLQYGDVLSKLFHKTN